MCNVYPTGFEPVTYVLVLAPTANPNVLLLALITANPIEFEPVAFHLGYGKLSKQC